MRHGFLNGFPYITSWISIFTIILLIGILVALISYLSGYIRKKNDPDRNRLFKILSEKLSKAEISEDEYRERGMILDDETWTEIDNSAFRILKERYARCEIDSREYVKIREELTTK